MPEILWVAAGGALGASVRYALSAWIVERVGAAFPWHTLTINVTGSLVVGILLTWLLERPGLDPAWRLFLTVGFLGGYTTFSAYSFEVLTLAAAGDWREAGGYVLASNVLGLAAVGLGALLTRAVSR